MDISNCSPDEVISAVEAMASPVDMSVILGYAQALESVGRSVDAVAVMRGLHDAHPVEALASVTVAAMCRLSIRDAGLLKRYAELYPGGKIIKAGISEMALQDGDLSTGFDLCHNRWAVTHVVSEIAGLPAWDGTRPTGPLLVAAEQGLGEEILFSCMFGEIPPAIISCDPRLAPLFERSFPQHQFIPKGTVLDYTTADCLAISAMELGKFYRRAQFTNPRGWLIPDADRVADIAEAIADEFPGRTCAGLSWRSARLKIGDSKSIPVADLIPLINSGPVFFDLQYGDHQSDLDTIRAAGGELMGVTGLDVTSDIDGLAALICSLDVVVTCSNTTAHLAGALGKRTILLAPGGTFVLWYWGIDGATTPWYPSIEILRGPPRQSWADLTAEVQKII